MFPGHLVKANITVLEHVILVTPRGVRVPVFTDVIFQWSKELADDLFFKLLLLFNASFSAF